MSKYAVVKASEAIGNYELLNASESSSFDTLRQEGDLVIFSVPETPESLKVFSQYPLFSGSEIRKILDEGLLSEIDYSKSSQKVDIGASTGLGLPLVAIKKPDGNSVTLISHNFCDNTTWPSTDNSMWQIAPQPGKILNVLRAEVQFTHDIEMATLSPTPEQMHLDVMAGGFPADSKVFPSVASVFDLGNDHFTMTGVVDGTPSMTTVRFDYQDTIVLRSSLGMSMDFYLNSNIELGGTHCTVSVIVQELDE